MNVKIPPTGTIPVRMDKIIRETKSLYLLRDKQKRILWVPKNQVLLDSSRHLVFHINVEFAAQNSIVSNVVIR